MGEMPSALPRLPGYARTQRTLFWSAGVVATGLLVALGGQWLAQRGGNLGQDTAALQEFVATLAQVLSRGAGVHPLGGSDCGATERRSLYPQGDRAVFTGEGELLPLLFSYLGQCGQLVECNSLKH